MTSSFLPASDGALDQWSINFTTKATKYAAQIPLTATEINAINAAQQEFQAALDSHHKAVQAARALRVAKQTARRKLKALAGNYNARIQASPAASDAVKADMGLTVRRKPVPVTPLAPIQVVATGSEGGVNTVRWKTGGNKRGTVYHIEAMTDEMKQWILIGSVTATRFDHAGQTPGVRVLYRIVAKRRNEFSAPSVAAVVYAGTNAANVQTLAKAA